MSEIQISIRRACLSDADQLPGLFEDALRLIAARFYTPEQIRAWTARKSLFEDRFVETFDTRAAWVAENEDGALKAYLDLLPDGHIDFFYAHPDVTRTSTTSSLYELLEAEARRQSIDKLTTEASEAARRFFEKRGFVIISRNDVWLGETRLHNFSMEKVLTPQAPENAL